MTFSGKAAKKNVEEDSSSANAQRKEPASLTTTPWTVLLSALASMVGLQKRSLLERDFASGKAWHFILAGVLVTLLFILGVVLVVQLVLRTLPVQV